MTKYPMLEINLNKILKNALHIVELCADKGITVAGVSKGVNAMPEIVKTMVKGGCKYIADSRIDHIIEMKNEGINAEYMLLRLPMMCEINEVVKYADISLNSEIDTLNALEKECNIQKKHHKVILMMDVGDLREGIMDKSELVDLAVKVEKEFAWLELAGIGTNLGCYGSIAPTQNNLGELVETARDIESKIGRKLEFVSGGSTSSLSLVVDDKMVDGINNLRIGEGILLGARDIQDLWGYNIKELHKDTFVLKAQVVEVKTKPTYPIGEFMTDAFSQKPTYTDRGIRKRALIAVGRQDFAIFDQLIPREKGIQILGASSDHLILDIQDCESEIKVGDILEFEMFYGPMLFMSSYSLVRKVFVND